MRFPCCWDLYGLAHWTPESDEQRAQISAIVGYIIDERFQNTSGGYLWVVNRNVCHSASRAVLAVMTEERRVLFLELAARFAQCQGSSWFRTAIADLDQYGTGRGTWDLPSSYLSEKRDGYYFYGGNHMGLGESRRRRIWREVESTFRVLNISGG